MNRLRIALFMILALVFAGHAWATVVPAATCSASLLSLRRPFKPNVLYEDKSIATGNSFFASNEFDWFRAEIDTEKTDLVLGFGTNSAWDIAVRKNADELIIDDWNAEPLKGQEFLMAPFILEATTPAEFISFLAGVTLPEKFLNAPIENTFSYINQKIVNFSWTEKEEQDYLKFAAKRFENCKKCSYEQQRFVASYFSDLFEVRRQYRKTRSLLTIEGSQFAGFEGPDAFLMGAWLYPFFEFRYNPISLIQEGARPEVVLRDDFSVVSSLRMFQRLQKLFDGHAHFIRSDALNPNTYRAVKDFGQSHGVKSYTVSLSNIIDVIQPARWENRPSTFDAIRSELATPGHPAHIFETRQTGPPHFFEHKILKANE